MAFINRMTGQDYIDKTREYLNYLEEHLENVRRAFCDLSTVCDGMHWVGDDFSWHSLRAEVECHDLSKFSVEEFVQYRKSFYPVSEKERENSDLESAWKNHKQKNTHHHESVKSYIDVIHMVIDWTAMSYKFGGSAQQYYEENKNKITLELSLKNFMYEIFDKVREKKGSC